MALPEQFGHYEVRSELGRGGMAIVYKCWEEALHRFVAIKVLSPQLATDNDIKERFFREAKSMAAVSHPNVINVHFIGEENGLPFFAMEYIEGQSLSQILRDNRALDVEHAKNILHQACEGLQAAHESGLIHRDIKPGNILISNNGFLKLMDFGIAQSK
ncbi:MAG TPA: serine/threonine-protein kinase, partial [Gammaproteobacteria bacterium]|nr:serine/threonine-protein kinase [Gammaproteobacteria bacterium]